MQWAKDGGPNSPVDAFYIIEIKSLFSIMLLRFGEGVREAFHSHAFNAWTFWISNSPIEERLMDGGLVVSNIYDKWSWKYTSRSIIHRYILGARNWALTFRGPWKKTWQEARYTLNGWEITTLKTPGREIINREYREYL